MTPRTVLSPERRLARRLAVAVVLGGLVLPSASARDLRGQSRTDVLLHGSPLAYSGGSKDDGFAAGIYATWGADLKHLVELGGTFTRIDYADGYRLDQADLAAAYSRYWARGSVRLGGHYIEATDPLTDGGFVAFGGIGAYRVGVWGAGAEAAFSRYARYGTGLNAFQLAPSVGFSAGRADGAGLFGIVLRGYYIRLAGDTTLAGEEFTSAEGALYYTIRGLTLSATGWDGEQAFAVRSAGFLVFNIPEVHTGGYGGGARLVLTPRSALSAGIYVERLLDMNLGTSATSRAIAVSLGFTL
jgi:hypothetical protein